MCKEREREKAMRTFSVQHLLQNDQSLKANNHVVKAKTSLTVKNLLEINTRQTVAYSILVETQHHTQGVKRDLIIGVYQQDGSLQSDKFGKWFIKRTHSVVGKSSVDVDQMRASKKGLCGIREANDVTLQYRDTTS